MAQTWRPAAPEARRPGDFLRTRAFLPFWSLGRASTRRITYKACVAKTFTWDGSRIDGRRAGRFALGTLTLLSLS